MITLFHLKLISIYDVFVFFTVLFNFFSYKLDKEILVDVLI